MLIHFDEIENTVVPRLKGGEGVAQMRALIDENNRIMRCVLTPGSPIGLHTHEKNSEIIYVLSGRGKVLYDGVWEPLAPGSCHYCPMGHSHSMVNDGTEELVSFAVVPEHKN